MNILFAPCPPLAIRELAESFVSSEDSLRFVSEDAAEFSEALGEAEVLLGVPRQRLDAEFLAGAPVLRLIQLLRKGVDKVDLAAMKSAGVRVATIGDLTAPFVAEHAIAMILALGRDLMSQHALVSENRWTDAKPWQKPAGHVDSVPYALGSGVSGKKLGLLGMGNIGGRVARIALALGMEVAATTRAEVGAVRDGVPQVSIDTLLESSDFLSLHLNLSDDTREIVNASTLAQMPRASFLVNTARGALVDEAALAEALDSGHIRGAGLDTLSTEPPPSDHILLRRPNVLLTPHTGWLSSASWRSLLEFGFENLQRHRAGADLRFQV